MAAVTHMSGAEARLTLEQQQRRRKRENLRLARARMMQQLAAANDTRYTEMLRKTITDLDLQIAALK